MKLIPTILCGGAGSRLWPVSRELHPKPFIRLADNQSFLQKSFIRGAILPEVSEVLTVTNRELLFKTKDDYREVNTANMNTSFLLEPFARNTAAAVALAALYVAKQHGDDAILLILTADHLIADQAAFQQAVMDATAIAQTGKMVTFGIQPNAPETGYGYIEANQAKTITHAQNTLGYEVARFVEKPDLATAQAYVDSGKFYWNSGMFCATASTLIAELKQHAPDIFTAANACFDASLQISTDVTQVEFEATSFANVPSNSIDYAVMEKSANVAVIPCDIGWNDIGAWDAMSSLTAADDDGNRISGNAILNMTTDCFVQSDKRVVALVGLDNIMVIDTPDALLVANRSHVQNVKDIYNQLKQQNHDAHKLHQTVNRPWGNYTVLEEGPAYKIKRIEVKPGAKLSLQMHKHRSEHWVVISGEATISNNGIEFILQENQSTYISKTHQHRLSNHSDKLLQIIEVQCGDYVGEDDIVRFDDHYGRVKAE
ncbi:MAG TPA: mannose-1-phosphate guanylyltransferase/mannose-6-phosphate isomerase [Methylophilus sp.]